MNVEECILPTQLLIQYSITDIHVIIHVCIGITNNKGIYYKSCNYTIIHRKDGISSECFY